MAPAWRRFGRPAGMIDALEPRRMLTYTILGTSGHDVVQLAAGGSGYIVKLNGTEVANSADLNVIISAGAGNDTIVTEDVLFGSSITVRGGTGNDLVEVGDGRLFSSLNGHVYLEEFDGEGEDTFIANDIFDNAIPDRPVRVRDNLLTSGTGSTTGVHYDDNIEHKSLLCSSAADTVYVESPAAGMVLNLSDGDDIVEFGSITANDLPDFMAPGTINAGAGFDRMIFDDSGGQFDEQHDYFIDSTRFENQTLIAVERAELRPRTRGGLSRNTIQMSGTAGISSGNQINFLGSNSTNLEIGSETQHVNVSPMWASLFMEMNGDVEIRDQAAVNDGNEWSLSRSQLTNQQLIQKGVFSLRLEDSSSRSVGIYGGTTNDSFAVSGLKPNYSYYINGGEGDDTLRTANANGHDNDLDEIFYIDKFTFSGGPGYDTADLDDTGDQLGDGDHIYHLRGNRLDKGVGQLFKWGASDDDELEQVRLVTGADDNTIYFRGPPTFATSAGYTIDAGAGNDYITNYIPDFDWNGGDLSWSYHDATVVGGAGNDILAIDDTANNAPSRSYHFDANYRMSAPSDITFDASTETVRLEASDGSGTIRIDAKPINTTLTVNGRGGDDHFIVGGGDIDSNGFSLATVTLTGGAGIDSMRFNDSVDTDPGNETEAYLQTALAGVNKLGKGLFGVNYSTFEAITLDVANGTPGAENLVDIRSLSILITDLTINGGSARYNTVNIGSTATGNINDLTEATFNLNFAGGSSDTVNLYNQNSTLTNVYELNLNQLLRQGGQSPEFIVNHSGVETFNLRAGSNFDYFHMNGSAPDTGIVVYANGGDDVFWISDTWAAIAGVAIFIGGTGSDHFLSGASGATTLNATLTDTGMAVNSSPFQSYYECEQVSANFDSAPVTFNIKSISVPTSSSLGGSSNAAITIGDGNIQANIRATLNVSGGFLANTVITYDDRLDTGNDSYQFQPDLTFFKRDGVTNVQTPLITAGGFLGRGTQILLANNGDNTIVCNTIVQDLRIMAHGGNDSVNAVRGNVSVDTGPENAPTALFGDSVVVNSDAGDPDDVAAGVRLIASDALRALDVRSAGTFQIPTGVTANLASTLGLTLSGGTIDLAGGAVLVRNWASPISTIRNLIISGRNAGAWNGTNAGGAINSSLAAGSSLSDGVGYGLGSQIAPTSIGPFTINAGDALLRYTLDGDADLNQMVDIADFSRVSTNFNRTNTAWADGDSNYDSVVDIGDFASLAGNFNLALPRRAANFSSAFITPHSDRLAGESDLTLLCAVMFSGNVVATFPSQQDSA